MFKENDIFKLVKLIPGENILIGTIGAILIVHLENTAYEVEFCDASGRNIGTKSTYTLTEDYMAKDYGA